MNRLSWKHLLMGAVAALALAALAPKADAHAWGSDDCAPPSCHMGWCSNCYGCCDRGCGCCWRSWWGVCGYTPWYSPAWGCGVCCGNCGYCGYGPAAPTAAPAPASPTPAPAAPAAPAATVPAPSASNSPPGAY
jgi:hypothetical protein